MEGLDSLQHLEIEIEPQGYLFFRRFISEGLKGIRIFGQNDKVVTLTGSEIQQFGHRALESEMIQHADFIENVK